MKKNILIFAATLATLSLSAFGYLNWSPAMAIPAEKTACKVADFGENPVYNVIKKTELYYHVGVRFATSATKESLKRARSILDILPEKATRSMESCHYVRVSILEDAQETDQQETGESEVLNAAQIELLQSMDYSTNFYIRADYKVRNPGSDGLMSDYLTYFLTLVPEKQAEYAGGYEAIIEYLKANSWKETATIQRDQLQPGKFGFTVTKEGEVADVKLLSTSGYPAVDEVLVELIANMPENWEPASNSQGEAVDQELVVFFGIEGC